MSTRVSASRLWEKESCGLGSDTSNIVLRFSSSVSSNLGAVTRTGIFSHRNKKCPISGKRLIRGYTKFVFTVDGGKGRLNPFRENN